jgi:hypothetical protein
MCTLKGGFVPRGSAWRAPLMAVLVPAVMVGGCGHVPENSYAQASWYAGGPRQEAAAVPIPVEMEDDGRPAQLPPRADVRAAPDDPSEPWSPNYGGPARAARVPAAPKALPQRVASADRE